MKSYDKCNILHKVLLRAMLVIVFLLLSATTTVFAFPVQGGMESFPPGSFYVPSHQIVAPFVTPAHSWRTHMLTDRAPTRRHEGLNIRGAVPRICSSFSPAPYINRHIDDEVITSLISEARRLRARAMFFDFSYHPTNDIVSVVITADVFTTLPHTLVRSVNFCMYSGQLLSMNDATGMEIMPLAERVLAEKIRSNRERYYAALAAPIPDAFYLTYDSLVILFDGFRLSSRVEAVDTIELALGNILTAELGLDEYRPDGPYDLKMIPLRIMLEQRLGYDVRWVEDFDEHGRFLGGRAIISRNDIDLIEMRANDNEYIIHGAQRRTLEAAPQLFFNEYTREYDKYVPITFFDQILPLTTYTINDDGSITFLLYQISEEDYTEY